MDPVLWISDTLNFERSTKMNSCCQQRVLCFIVCVCISRILCVCHAHISVIYFGNISSFFCSPFMFLYWLNIYCLVLLISQANFYDEKKGIQKSIHLHREKERWNQNPTIVCWKARFSCDVKRKIKRVNETWCLWSSWTKIRRLRITHVRTWI